MTPDAMDALLTRACAMGSTLEYVLSNMNGRVPCIIKWEDDHRRSICGPWNDFMHNAECWDKYRDWHVFDYELYEYDPPNLILHIKEYERSDTNGKGQTK